LEGRLSGNVATERVVSPRGSLGIVAAFRFGGAKWTGLASALPRSIGSTSCGLSRWLHSRSGESIFDKVIRPVARGISMTHGGRWCCTPERTNLGDDESPSYIAFAVNWFRSAFLMTNSPMEVAEAARR